MTLASTSLFQGTINHIWLDFDGAVDSTRLKDACTTLVNHHGILRTLFAFWGESLMQVILRSSQAEFRERKANDNVEEATMEFVGESKQGVEKLGRSGLRFCFINHRAGGRLVIRVPHSLYDGISLPLVLDHLRLAYEGLSIPVSPSFTKYLNAWRFLQETGGSKTFWQKRLQGSVMTEIIASKYQNHPQDANGHLMQRIIHAPFSSSKHTFETLLHVSWALVLRALSGKSDIVFGRAVANRNLPIPASDNVVGPCLNTVPVRVQFDRFRTYYDLLSTTENERLAALPYECLETDVLISDCTSWRTGSRFSSLLVHNNLTAAKTFDDGRLPHFGGIPCSLGWTVSPWDAADVQITSTPETTTNSIRIDLVYAKAALPQELAQIMLSRLCQTIGTLCESGDQDLEPTVTQHKCLPVVPGCGSPYSFNVSSPNSPAPSTPSSYELV
ncbi:CoA-dependent acyltransferase [Saccharata proteae CBS 121410]|uniref:CoA-dependent acyltransferase n=1 Tax=Saccharata proteae CBS 121410 TaxID=1314787 RepID=A0A6A5YG13_9PEZI|nr:CoA-dependent acyltransferase [Saccharata proteae CBS 121410]